MTTKSPRIMIPLGEVAFIVIAIISIHPGLSACCQFHCCVSLAVICAVSFSNEDFLTGQVDIRFNAHCFAVATSVISYNVRSVLHRKDRAEF